MSIMFCNDQFVIKHISQIENSALLVWDKVQADGVDFCGIKKVEEFIKKLLDTPWFYLGFYKNELIGMFAVDRFETCHCGRIHFWVFKRGIRVMVPACRCCLLWLFDECKITTLITWTPAGFPLGGALALRLGASVIGMIPNAIITHRGSEAVTVGYLTRESVIMGMPDPPEVQPAPKMPDPKPMPIDEANKDVRDAKRNSRQAEAAKFNQADTLLAGALSSDPNAVGKKKLLG